MPPYNPNLFAMVSAAAVFAPRGLPLVKVDDIGVSEHVAYACRHVRRGRLALSLIRFLRTFLLQSRGDRRRMWIDLP